MLSDCIDLDFLYHLMTFLDLPRFADYVGQPKITQKPLETLDYIIPSKAAQNDFVSFVQQSDKSKLMVPIVDSSIRGLAVAIGTMWPRYNPRENGRKRILL